MPCCTWPISPGARVNKPADVLTVGQQIEVKILKVDAGQAAAFRSA